MTKSYFSPLVFYCIFLRYTLFSIMYHFLANFDIITIFKSHFCLDNQPDFSTSYLFNPPYILYFSCNRRSENFVFTSILPTGIKTLVQRWFIKAINLLHARQNSPFPYSKQSATSTNNSYTQDPLALWAKEIKTAPRFFIYAIVWQMTRNILFKQHAYFPDIFLEAKLCELSHMQFENPDCSEK